MSAWPWPVRSASHLVRLLMLAASLALAGGSAGASDLNVDRPGHDVANFDLATADPGACESSCAGNASCAAWTYVKPGVQGPKARCWLKDAVPPPQDSACCTSGLKKTGAMVGPGVDMPGGDYSNFDLASADPNLCQSACAGDQVCAAWTYVKPGVQGPKARCWLKSSLSPARPAACCTSGMKPFDGVEHGTDRPGSDIANFDLASPDPAQCQSACAGNGSCQAWTYVKPGVQGPKARCWLKNSVPAAVGSSCCASGVKPPNSWSTRYAYATACAKEMGIIPPFDCMDGEILPITNGGVPQTSIGASCDKPVILGVVNNQGSQCVPYARLVRIVTGVPNVETLAVCRKYVGSTGAGDARFDDIALVQHNKSTGNTCFFQSALNDTGDMNSPERHDGNFIPGPTTDTADARKFWLETGNRQGPGGINCMSCHDADPFIYSPYIAQKADESKWDPTGQYHHDPFGIFGNAASFQSVQPNGNLCSGCHRIGTSSWHGIDSSWGDKAMKYSMPPGNTLTGASWEAAFAAHVTQLNDCVANTAKPGCNGVPH